MNAVTRAVDAIDRLQQRHPWLAFPVAVFKKFGDDRAGNLAALIAYYAFIATFPLLLVFVTVLDIVLRNYPQLHSTLLNSALAQYPVIGPRIKGELGTVSGTGLPLVVGIAVLLFGARGVAGAMRNALCEVWTVPRNERPGFPRSLLNDLALVFTVGLGFVVTTALSSMAAGVGHVLNGAVTQVITIAFSLVLNVGVFWLAFRIATARKVPWHELRIGAALAAIIWQVLQVAGGYVVGHQLNRASTLYGIFGVVLGLLAWLYLQAEATLLAAEIDVVYERRLWPRSLRSDSQVESQDVKLKEEAQHDQRAA